MGFKQRFGVPYGILANKITPQQTLQQSNIAGRKKQKTRQGLPYIDLLLQFIYTQYQQNIPADHRYI